jgi:hypothetical protein
MRPFAVSDNKHCRRSVGEGEFVEHARLGERIGALQEVILQHADPPRVEAIEAADRADALLEIDCGGGRHGDAVPQRDIVNELVDLVK